GVKPPSHKLQLAIDHLVPPRQSVALSGEEARGQLVLKAVGWFGPLPIVPGFGEERRHQQRVERGRVFEDVEHRTASLSKMQSSRGCRAAIGVCPPRAKDRWACTAEAITFSKTQTQRIRHNAERSFPDRRSYCRPLLFSAEGMASGGP